jgi:hypothetical protein
VDGQITAPGKGSLVKVLLMRDRMGVGGEHTIAINGRELPAEAFSPVRIYDQNNIAADVSHYLISGVNEIVVLLTASKDWQAYQTPCICWGISVCCANTAICNRRGAQNRAGDSQGGGRLPILQQQMTYDCELSAGNFPAMSNAVSSFRRSTGFTSAWDWS